MKIKQFSIFFNLFQEFQIDKRKGLVSYELAASEESVGHEFTGSERHSLRIRHGFSFSSSLFLVCALRKGGDERPSYGDRKTLIARAYRRYIDISLGFNDFGLLYFALTFGLQRFEIKTAHYFSAENLIINCVR